MEATTCLVCGDTHTKKALAERYGYVIDAEGSWLKAKLPPFDKMLRLVNPEALEAAWKHIDQHGTLPTGVLGAVTSGTRTSAAAPGSIDAMIDARIDARLGGADIVADTSALEARIGALENADTVPTGIDESAVRAIVEDVVSHQPARVLVVQTASSAVAIEDADEQHEMLETVIRLAACEPVIALVGPAGTGKTSLAFTVARALGREATMTPCTEDLMASAFLGWQDANGVYHGTAYLDAYENGKLFIGDEWDQLTAQTAGATNAGFANGHQPVPKRTTKPMATRHERFGAILTLNTFGMGATREYCGRNQLDAASLDRIGGGTCFIEIGYSERIESRFSSEVREWAKRVRDGIAANKLRRVLSTRFLVSATRQLAAGFTFDEIKARYLAPWTPEERKRIGELV